ncbi:MAG TPA: peptide chain release factor-like protein [Candidatus Omnitrophota bacterium]|nr:peptide chain release factor-like protein [Candidatus Omnitrophota bacterium]
MARPEVFFDKEKELSKKMKRLKIYDHDIKEQFIRSSGPGGQNVNKVASCVVLHHLPTGVQVKCQAERSQALNRQKARYLLVEKIEHYKREEELKIRHAAEKKKRQQRKRPQGLKEEILEQKHKRAERKSLRKKIQPFGAEDF